MSEKNVYPIPGIKDTPKRGVQCVIIEAFVNIFLSCDWLIIKNPATVIG